MENTDSLTSKIKQYEFLVDLDDRLRPLIDPFDITLTAATFLGQYLDVDRCAYADVEPDQVTFNLIGNYTRGVPSIVGRYDGTAFGAEFLSTSHDGVPYVVEDVETDARVIDIRDTYRQTKIRAVVSVPVIKSGKFVAGMALHQATPRKWRDSEIKLLEMVAHRCWESIERNRVTRELRESEASFRTITNAMPQLVWTARPDGFVDYHNEKLYDFAGVPRGTTGGDAWKNLVHPDDQERAFEVWTASVATGAAYETTYRVRHHSGEYRWTLARALPVRDDSGTIVKWLGTNTDIHSQKMAEELLQEANRRKDEFLAMLAHELRNPLAPISAAAELLSMTKSEDEQVKRTSEIIRRQVAYMTSLVDELLDVSRVTRGLVKLDKSILDAKQVVADAVEQVQPLIEQHKHRLSIHLAPELVYVFGDHKRLVQVLSNLLHNAAKYTPDGGNIAVTMETTESEVTVAVTDNGVGMKPEMLGNVFELFLQGERAADRAQGGLGIGLALVKSLVEQHHGKVTAKSEGPGCGSEMVVHLPRAQKGEEAGITNAPALVKSKVRRILVVDDNADAAQVIAMLLEELGNQVAVEYTPEEALVRADQVGFDVFILDIGLPSMDGYELARELRSRPKNQNATFAALTGYGSEHDKAKSKAAGFDHHFVKPINFTELVQALRTLD